MIYDDAMRDRLVQLIGNEYQGWELDSLVTRQMNYRTVRYEDRAMELCKFDTLQIFGTTLDSFFMDMKQKSINDTVMYERYTKNETFYKKENRYNVFKLLKLDTTTTFKQAYNKIVERERERERESYLSGKAYYNYTYLAEICGHIGDKRFIQPLKEALDKPNNFQRKKVLEALVRLHVEPYYGDYVKEITLTSEQIQNNEGLKFSLDDFVRVLGTQEAFLELSKYLLSNKPYKVTMIEYENRSGGSYTTPVSYDAFSLISDYLENESLQTLIKTTGDDEQAVYEWMQKNYGKYKIRKIW